MPFIEDVIEEQKMMWGTYHPNQRKNGRSMVMVRNIGCVFIGSVQECQDYIRENEYKYDEKKALKATV